MFGDSDMYSSFGNPHNNSGQSFHVPVDSSSSPSPPFNISNNSAASNPRSPMPNMAMSSASNPHSPIPNMAMPTGSQSSQLEIPSHVFSQQLYHHSQFSPHMNMTIPQGGSLGALQEAVLIPQPVMSSAQAQQSFGINETVPNSAFSSQNCQNPSPFSPQDCSQNPEVKGAFSAQNCQNPSPFSPQDCSQNPEVKVVETVKEGAQGVEEEEVKKKNNNNSKESVQKKRAKNWSKTEIFKLAKLRREMEPRFEKGAKKAELWEEIAEALRSDGIYRDSHQCRDKWEKLMGAYKNWLKDGGKGREDNSLFEELNELLGGKKMEQGGGEAGLLLEDAATEERYLRDNNQFIDDEETDVDMATLGGRKRKRSNSNYVPVSDFSVVKELVVTVVDSYHRKVKEVLEALDRRGQAREQARLEKEQKWRTEEYAQREVFNNALLSIVQNLVVDHPRNANVVAATPVAAQERQKRRSKNWKAQEVREMIKLRGEMDGRFAEAVRRTPLWEELSDQLGVKGIKRDWKQCKEKWDKLQADYKDVLEGKKEEASFLFYTGMQTVPGLENVKPENTSMENVHPENDIMDKAHPDSVTRENTFVENVNPQ